MEHLDDGVNNEEDDGLEDPEDDEEGGDEVDDPELDDDDDEEAGSKRKGAVSLSMAMQEFLGVESMGRRDVLKRILNHINEHNLKDPSDKRKIILDDKLSKLFTAPLTMVTLNKQLTNHITKEGAEDQQKMTRKRGRPSKGGDSRAGKKKGRGGGRGLAKPLKVSTELADFLGSEEISRQDLTKFMWSYFKENDLQNPDNRSEIIADEKLRSLMNVDRFRGFGFMKFLKQHIMEG